MNKDQIKGLNAAVDSYNKSGGKDGVKIKNADGSISYVKYNMSVQGVADVDDAVNQLVLRLSQERQCIMEIL